jgi:hypothetical protein
LGVHDRRPGELLGAMPHGKVVRAIELFGTEVAPAVRKEFRRRSASSTGEPAAV